MLQMPQCASLNTVLTEALVAGESVRDWCVSVATMVFLKQVRLVRGSSLFLTPLQAQVFANATDSSLLGARPILRATEGKGYYTPEKGMRDVLVVTQPNPTVQADP